MNESHSGASFDGCWSAVAQFLRAAHVSDVFGLPSDDLTALAELSSAGVRMVVCRDQRNAMHMATGYAQRLGKPAVCIVGKGPAVSNLVTGLLEAATSRTPVLVLAVSTPPDRQHAGAFQDCDQLAMVRATVKRALRVDDAGRVPAVLQQAWSAASSGAPGPVFVEFGEQLLSAAIPPPVSWAIGPERTEGFVPPADSAALALLGQASRPLIVVGGGARRADAGAAVLELAEMIGAGIVCTASGRGAVDETHTQFLGLVGLYGRPVVTELLASTDLVISIGSRLEETATVGWPVPASTPVIQVNIAADDCLHEFCGPVVEGDAGAVIGAWTRELKVGDPGGRLDPGWTAGIANCRSLLFEESATTVWEQQREPGIKIAELLWALRSATSTDITLVQENGLLDMWTYFFPYFLASQGDRVVAPSEQTALGFGAAAAVGAGVAAPDVPVVAVVGDGAFTMFAADLPTAAENRAGVVYLVLCNGGYGWLQAEADAHGTDDYRFADPQRPLPLISAAGVSTVTVLDKNKMLDQLTTAIDLAAEGEVVVALVPTDLADMPPGIADFVNGTERVAQTVAQTPPKE
ncbi:thiamine pyrophosphate-binding protein [Nakamurella aerolata]|uniref:Thiamine pyrophosphate-binding protein n=1 Tax=Nakamurella aerolata TaxID=1656892 RepID=A0A849A9P3_9ACTN|nr:thiamine pyrophosphate-binding protein [Nakamurella aerolata]NNG36687.1 thiamine pyrophosphate-binding protein [Nakamurella aerolata]